MLWSFSYKSYRIGYTLANFVPDEIYVKESLVFGSSFYEPILNYVLCCIQIYVITIDILKGICCICDQAVINIYIFLSI